MTLCDSAPIAKYTLVFMVVGVNEKHGKFLLDTSLLDTSLLDTSLLDTSLLMV